jgi:Arc/MetJ-type ribon-helix-helix transcriptional regulator
MSGPDFEQMTKDEVITWFKTTNDLSPFFASVEAEPVSRPLHEIPMIMASIRLPVVLVEQLDNLADVQRTRRSDVIRDALVAYVTERTAPVGRDEAERALDVLRRIVASRVNPHGQAA